MGEVNPDPVSHRAHPDEQHRASLVDVQWRFWREGGLRVPALARATRGRIGVGHWTSAELRAVDAAAVPGVAAKRWCATHTVAFCVHRPAAAHRA